MIIIIDKIQYLKEKRNKIIDENKIINDIFKERIKKVKSKLKTSPLSNEKVTVTLVGTPNKEIKILTDTNSEEISEKIQRIAIAAMR